MIKNVLLIVDPQIDFIIGSMAAPGAENKMHNLVEWIVKHNSEIDEIFVTMDSHPENHCSFAINGGQWPTHCVTGSVGWEIYPALTRLRPMEHFMKGKDADKEEYSVFQNDDHGEELYEELLAIKANNEDFKLYVAGIAGDYCVMNTIKDLEELGFKNNIIALPNCIASIDQSVFDKFITDYKTE